MRPVFIFSVGLGVSLFAMGSPALAQNGGPVVPQKHIPAPVLLELRTLESQFDQALFHDCAPERCVSKGCVYGDHVVVDMPRTTSLPGIEQAEGVGSVPAQEYLTQARCDFAYEKSVSARDVLALTRRLEQRLSKGWLKVTVGKQVLEPISAALSESPPPKPEPVVAPKALPVAAPLPPAKWEAGVALRELWQHLLPHFAWMIAVVLGTLAALILIWAARRLGRPTLEERALLQQLENGGLAPPVGSGAPEPALSVPETEKAELLSAEQRAAAAFVVEQQKFWTERIAQTALATDSEGIVEVLREWLTAREFALLAKAIFVFGDHLSVALASDGELAMRKVEFAEYLQHLDEKLLPTDEAFFRTLNHHAISSALLAQADADIYRSLREEFGSTGVAHLVEALPRRQGALLFALVSPDAQQDVARTLSPELRLQVANQLLGSNRMSDDDRKYIFSALDEARAGRPLPPPPRAAAHDIVGRGREFDAAAALSSLFPHIEAEDRQALFLSALQRSSGVFPLWYEDILYPDMLLKLPEELRADLLLQVDLKGLGAWSSLQPQSWQQQFLSRLSASMQNAVRANSSFSSRPEQLRLAKLGHDELVGALKRVVSSGRVSFPELVA